MTIKLNCSHVDTCLSDYWSGHHLPHVQIAVHKRMTINQVRDAIRDEIRQGAIAGTGDDARLLSADIVRPDEEKRADALTRAAYAAINRDVKMRKPGKRYPFIDLEDTGDDCDGESIYAFFVFSEA